MYYDALTDFFQSGREVKTQFSPQKGLTNDAKSQSHDTMGPNYFSKFNKYVQLFYSLLGYLDASFSSW